MNVQCSPALSASCYGTKPAPSAKGIAYHRGWGSGDRVGLRSPSPSPLLPGKIRGGNRGTSGDMIPIHSNSSCSAADVSVVGLSPGARRAILRPSRFSRPVTNSGALSGRPVASARRRSLKSSSASTRSSFLRCGIQSRTGRTVTSASSTPDRCALTLDHFHSSGRLTSRAPTGFLPT